MHILSATHACSSEAEAFAVAGTARNQPPFRLKMSNKLLEMGLK